MTYLAIVTVAFLPSCKESRTPTPSLAKSSPQEVVAVVLTGTHKGNQQKYDGSYESIDVEYKTCVSKQAKKIVGDKFAKDAAIQRYYNFPTAESVFHFGDIEPSFIKCAADLIGSWRNARPGVNDPQARAVYTYKSEDFYIIQDESDLTAYGCDPQDNDNWSKTKTKCYSSVKEKLVPDYKANGGKYLGDWTPIN